jgi:cystathionine beta-synthase
VVVILPDSGSRYLSKVFDDKWMRENGFLEARWNDSSLSEVLSCKPNPSLITARTTDRITDVIHLLKENDISQAPVLDDQGSVAGMVTEIDLLKHMLEAGHRLSPEETIAPIVQPAQAAYPAHTQLEEVLPAVMDGYVILVTESDRPAGILTKIDILDFIAQEA